MVVIGASMGGFHALQRIFSPLPADLSMPVLVVRHQAADTDPAVIHALNRASHLQFKFAEEGEKPRAGVVYIAPPDQHLLVSRSGKIHLSSGQRVNHSRPSIDPLFTSASEYYGRSLLAVVLTGSNRDGVDGCKSVKQAGGAVLVQDPASAESDILPTSVLQSVEVDHLVWLDQIGAFLWGLNR